MSHEKKSFWTKARDVVGFTVATSIATVAGMAVTRYKVAKPHQMLVRTGLGIRNGMVVSKQGMQWPFQRSSMVNLSPATVEYELHNMSKGKVEFSLPVVFTVAPADPDGDAEGFERYAKLSTDMSPSDLNKLIQGIVEGETRGLTSQLTVEEIFNAKDKFREDVVARVAEDLSKIGVRVLNANIREMRDCDEHNKYFEYRKRRAIETANYEAQVEVAKAQRDGETGVKANESEARKLKAELEMEAKLKENEARQRIVESEAAVARVEQEVRLQVEKARVEVDNEVMRRNCELARDVEAEREKVNVMRTRADELSRVQVEADMARLRAEGYADAARTKAAADLFAKQKEAEGVLAVMGAQADGLHNMLEAADPELVRFYLAREQLVPLAQAHASAFRDMKPEITVWDGKSQDGVSNAITDITRSLAPLGKMLGEKGVQLPMYSDKVKP